MTCKNANETHQLSVGGTCRNSRKKIGVYISIALFKVGCDIRYYDINIYFTDV